MEHELKTWSSFYQAISDGFKKFEIRKNDRDFKVGDVLVLREYQPMQERYTGKSIKVRVEYILNGENFGIHIDYCVMSISRRGTL